MRTIKAKPITVENFHYYGQFVDILNPDGYSLGDFFHDRVKMNMAGNMNLAFSPLVVHKTEPRIVTQAEYHNTTQEGILCLDDDFILHVAPPSKEPVPELTEAFLVPKGTLVCLNLGVWHLSAMPLNLETAHVLIVLPERIYMNDLVLADYEEKDQICIEV